MITQCDDRYNQYHEHLYHLMGHQEGVISMITDIMSMCIITNIMS